MHIRNITKNQSGVTLLELIVAMTIFTIAILSSVQIFNLTLKNARDVRASQQLDKEVRYAYEVLSKEVRMARVDRDAACITRDELFEIQGGSLLFLNSDDECVEYKLEDTSLKIVRDSFEQSLTSENVVVEEVNFEITGFPPLDHSVATVNMTLHHESAPNKEMTMQTSLSSRDYE